MTDIRELEKMISPPLLTDKQLRTIIDHIDSDRNTIKAADYEKVSQLIEVKYARAMWQMTSDGHCIKEVCIRVNDNIEVSFRVRGLHVKCRIWNCVDEFDL